MKLEVGERGWYSHGAEFLTGVVAAHFEHDGLEYTVFAQTGPLPNFSVALTEVVVKDGFDNMGFARINDETHAAMTDFILERRTPA